MTTTRSIRSRPGALTSLVLRWLGLCLGAALALTVAGVPAHAEGNRFGTPWLGVVVINNATAYSGPSLDSPQVGPLGQGARLPVLSQTRGGPGPDGTTTWYGTPVGWLPSQAMTEHREPWLAAVQRDGVAVRVKPNAGAWARRIVNQGDLLRVHGLSPGLDGDTNIWWATNEGWVQLPPTWPNDAVLAPAHGKYANSWTMPKPEEALHGWWGRIVSDANVRAAATTVAPIVGRLDAGQYVKVLGEEQGQDVQGSATWYRIDGGRYAGAHVHSSLIRKIGQPAPDTTRIDGVPADGTWIVVNRSAGTITYIRDGHPVLATFISIGTALAETPLGRYGTYGKFRFDDMTSNSLPDAPHTYDIPNVPSTQYYRDGGYAIHGAYWHDDFGRAHSNGCVNLTQTDAAYLFQQTQPELPPGVNSRWSGQEPATPVLIRD